MRIVLSKRTTTVVVAAILVATAGAIGATAKAKADARPKGCSVVLEITDQSHLTMNLSDGPDAHAGDTVTYWDDLLDAKTGKVLGHGSGTALIYASPGDGSLWEAIAIYGTFPQGTFSGTTAWALADGAFGQPQTVPITGSSGSWLHKSGSWQMALYQRPTDRLSLFHSSLTICS